MWMEREIRIQEFMTNKDLDGVILGQWEDVQTLFAKAEQKNALTVYADYAKAQRSVVKLSVRCEYPVSQKNRILCEDTSYLVADVLEKNVDYLEICCVPMRYVHCVAERTEDVGGESREPSWETKLYADFPAALAEKYIKFEQMEPMARTETSYVLITPKAIRLRVSDLVEIDGFLDQYGDPLKFAVQVCHTLDEYKNEYEIVGKGDA